MIQIEKPPWCWSTKAARQINRLKRLFTAPIIHDERGFYNMCTYLAFGAFSFALGAIFATVGLLADRKGARR